MNESLRLTALFVRDLLGYNEQLIRIGRQNYDIDDFTIGYIGVDSLGAAQRLASGEKYDGNTEQMSFQQQWQAPVTLSFYGANAWTTATRFALLIQSQRSFNLQQSLGLGVYQVSALTDVKILAGQQYGERQDLTMNVRYATTADIDTLRIETAEFELINDTGILNYSFPSDPVTVGIWNESNWTITSQGAIAGGTWTDSTTLSFDEYRTVGDYTNQVFVYADADGVPGTANNEVSFDIEIDAGATSGEIVIRFYDTYNASLGVDEYIYPTTGQTLYTVTATVNMANLTGIAFFLNYGDVTGGPTIVNFKIL